MSRPRWPGYPQPRQSPPDYDVPPRGRFRSRWGFVASSRVAGLLCRDPFRARRTEWLPRPRLYDGGGLALTGRCSSRCRYLPLLLLEFDRPTLSRSDRTFLDTVNVIVLPRSATDYLVELGARSSSLAVRPQGMDESRHRGVAGARVACRAFRFWCAASTGWARAVRAVRRHHSLVAIAFLRRRRGGIAREASREIRDLYGGFDMGSRRRRLFMLAENAEANGHPHSYVDAVVVDIDDHHGRIRIRHHPANASSRAVAAVTMVVGISTSQS